VPFVLATFNVKDLFDATDSVSRAQLDAKLDWLAAKVGQLDADVLALQEVGSGEVLRALCSRLPDGGHYGAPLLGTADARGIRCAILSRRPVIASRVHTSSQLEFPSFFVGDPSPFGARLPLRRGVLHAEIDGGELGPVHALVMHFKSNRPVPLRSPSGTPLMPTSARERTEGELRSLAWRAAEALFVRGIVDDLLKDNLERNVAVMGDLNDAPQSTVVRIVCGDGPTALRPAAEQIPAGERFSHLHRGVPCQIDHLLLSSSLWARLQSARFLNHDLRDHSAIPLDQPTADSDHAPLVVTLA
jgi:endonuclease/exonuclease/phosphatase family metal-dependent hydrolase